jgi:60 kDa SS-A/Ro ribonucleoprotein
MGTFNKKAGTSNPRRTTNYEGEVAYTPDSPEMKLYIMCATAILQPKFYEGSVEQIITAIRAQASLCRPNFVANLAVYLRNDLYLRSVPIVLIVQLALDGTLPWRTCLGAIRRADEPKELAAAYKHMRGLDNMKKFPSRLRKLLAESLTKFADTPYSFKKYDGGGKDEVNYVDLLRMFHPKPKSEEQAVVFKMVKEGTLPPIETWETMISAAGSDPNAKKLAWEYLVNNNKLPYMAALRNLRNLLQAGVSPGCMKKVTDLIQDPEAVKKSMQFPFRWWSAYRELKEMDMSGIGAANLKAIFDALENAIRISVENIPGWETLALERILVACDASSSMMRPISARSKVQLYHIGYVLGFAMQRQIPNVTVGMFGERWKTLPADSNVLAGVVDAVAREGEVGYSTNGHLVVQWALDNRLIYDRFMFLTDNQMWNTSGRATSGRSAFESVFNKYKAEINPKAKLILFDLAGYGTTPIDLVRPDVALVAGWSDKVFKIISDVENGGELIKKLSAPAA